MALPKKMTALRENEIRRLLNTRSANYVLPLVDFESEHGRIVVNFWNGQLSHVPDNKLHDLCMVAIAYHTECGKTAPVTSCDLVLTFTLKKMGDD